MNPISLSSAAGRPLGIALWILGAAYGAPVGELARADNPLPNVIVIFADDLGYADIGAQGQAEDVRTPFLDALAAEGVRCTAGYVTAPQCSPSRAGLITGRYQQRFGLEENPDCPLPLDEVTIAERMQAAGYHCGMVGKWHLEPNAQSQQWARKHLPDARPDGRGRVTIPPSQAGEYFPHRQGFEQYLVGTRNRYFTNMTPLGGERNPEGDWIEDERFRVDVQSDAAVEYIRRSAGRAFFLYLSYFAPHVPLESPPEYLSRFPGEMPERRRYALAMLAAMDDGVGRLLEVLRERELDENTLIFFVSDNGAPLKLTREDLPLGEPAAWDGSLNTPWIGEKGMLAEGGIRVPFLVRWKGTLPAGATYPEPVSTLDIAATAVAAAGLRQDQRLEGVDLVPYLAGRREGVPHTALYWRFWNQAAVRAGDWKYLRLSDRAEYLFDLSSDAHEADNRIASHPDVAERLREQLRLWTEELRPPGLPSSPPNAQEENWYEHYFNLPPPAEGESRPNRKGTR
jgi:arylsulfatase A-like enzyme